MAIGPFSANELDELRGKRYFILFQIKDQLQPSTLTQRIGITDWETAITEVTRLLAESDVVSVTISKQRGLRTE
jgi:hypothetical protein